MSVEVTSSLVFKSLEAIIHTKINFPESCHDAKIANWSCLKYLKLSNNMKPSGYEIICHCVFKVDVVRREEKF